MVAIHYGRLDLLIRLVKHNGGEFPLPYFLVGTTIQNQKWGILEFFVDIFGINHVFPIGWSFLNIAIRVNIPAMVTYILDLGADINMLVQVDNQPATPLILAIYEGHLEVVRLLLQRGANPNYTENGVRSAVSWAIESYSEDEHEIFLLVSRHVYREIFQE
jgi:hypothetical protein